LLRLAALNGFFLPEAKFMRAGTLFQVRHSKHQAAQLADLKLIKTDASSSWPEFSGRLQNST
jgi:hypothetical protein